MVRIEKIFENNVKNSPAIFLSSDFHPFHLISIPVIFFFFIPVIFSF